ncbi:hypothetical protein AG1IA_06177 [Rhizoctonia solani AG-1 IA]|uniref:Uncharacterized protein n=1 Tax=Thanatephorus cucumeris (strain AG1-IA) TaxID=983506 RepID=L8WSU9_THACA|nr:hypothetical protein AG1IA_06177 [Rhizoctonia solani AG-1 IA]
MNVATRRQLDPRVMQLQEWIATIQEARTLAHGRDMVRQITDLYRIKFGRAQT